MTESELTARFAALADATHDGSWADVLARARRMPQRRPWRPALAIAAAFAVVVVAAAPAIGLGHRVVRLFGIAEPAPQRVVRSFEGWQEGAPPQIEAGRAIEVLQSPAGGLGTARLWLAPRRESGYCTLLQIGSDGGGGECEAVARDDLSFEVSIQGLEQGAGTVVLDGATADRRADSLVLRFEDGTTAQLRLVWVTAPIETGFFVYALSEDRVRAGHRPTTLTLYAVDGDKLAEKPVTGVTPS